MASGRASFERPSTSQLVVGSPGGPGLIGRAPTIIRVPGKGDIFDQEDFDATKFINKLYPDGADGTRRAGAARLEPDSHACARPPC